MYFAILVACSLHQCYRLGIYSHREFPTREACSNEFAFITTKQPTLHVLCMTPEEWKALPEYHRRRDSMKFREHRGALADSMATCVEIADRTALIEHLYRNFSAPLPFYAITISPYDEEPDRRIDWPCTYIVMLKGFGVIGFTDGPPP